MARWWEFPAAILALFRRWGLNMSEKEVLIVISKLKNYIKDQSGGFNTAGSVAPRLSHSSRTVQ